MEVAFTYKEALCRCLHRKEWVSLSKLIPWHFRLLSLMLHRFTQVKDEQEGGDIERHKLSNLIIVPYTDM